MKLGRDEVLMAPYLWLDFLANPAQGWMQGGANTVKGFNFAVLKFHGFLDGDLSWWF